MDYFDKPGLSKLFGLAFDQERPFRIFRTLGVVVVKKNLSRERQVLGSRDLKRKV